MPPWENITVTVTTIYMKLRRGIGKDKESPPTPIYTPSLRIIGRSEALQCNCDTKGLVIRYHRYQVSGLPLLVVY